ncbi:MAG: ATPase, T2SS/T4P/T4SS family, partial [bacterium]|nr:ATPase, T2SS/T4P/T4SS family [bacterium]
MPNNDVQLQQQPQENQPVAQAQNGPQTIADILLSEHHITQPQYDEIKVKSASQGKSAESIIELENLVPQEKLAEAKARLLGIPFIALGNTSFSPQALSFIPRAVAERFALVPFLYDEKTKTLSVAMGNPVDLEAISFIQQKTGLTIKSFAAAPSEVTKAISLQYRQELVGEVGAALKETEELKKIKTVDSTQIAQIIKEAPIAKIVSTILEYAVTSRASDVHIEPQEDRVRVRYRIDGILYDRLSLPKSVQEAVISRIKILSEMKIDEHRTPQDGRFNFKVAENEVDLRISVLPTAHGEKIVMRLLRKSGGIPTLPELGLSGTALKSLEMAILRPHGIIIVCGPTGSGKTTTLYSVLSKLNTTRVNLMSLEDPVEYQISGVNQVQINPAVGLTFATGLRAFLRQDPNIILVGEIRDSETTDLAIQAALTGHLVFSTLHTNDAASGVTRLVDIGVEPYLVASSVEAFVAQRLVRMICTHCKHEDKKQPDELRVQIVQELKLPSIKDVKLYRGKGCEKCNFTGFWGRVAIFEILLVNDEIREMIMKRVPAGEIKKSALAKGMRTLRQNGWQKVITGFTTPEEILEVAPDEISMADAGTAEPEKMVQPKPTPPVVHSVKESEPKKHFEK